jgi:S1-C subfamily serine protease
LTVREVQNGSPADQAGLRVGQEIIEVNGKRVRSLAALNQLVAAGANRRASVTVLENGVRRGLKLELMPLTQLNRQLILKRLGLNTAPLTEAQATNFKLAPSEGLLVENVEKASPADNAQLEAGMVVTKVEGVPVSDLVNISNVLGNKKRGESVHLAVKVANRYGGMIRVMEGTVDVAVR